MGILIEMEVVGTDSIRTMDSILREDMVSNIMVKLEIRVNFLLVVEDNILVVLQHTQEVNSSMLEDKQVEGGKGNLV